MKRASSRERETTPGNIAATLRRLARLLPKSDPRRRKLEADARTLDELHRTLTGDGAP